MGNGYPRVASDDIGALRDALKEAFRRLRELEGATGTQTYGAVAKVKEAIANIGPLVDSYLAAGFTTGSMTATGDVAVGGDVTVGGVTRSDAGLWSTSVYGDVLTSAYHATWARSDGKLGYVPSSRRFKQDEAPANVDLSAALAIQVVTFRYIQAVEELGDAAGVEWGVIAEDLHALGFTWLVDYDADGLPFGVKKEQLVLAFIPVVQDHERRLQALEA